MRSILLLAVAVPILAYAQAEGCGDPAEPTPSPTPDPRFAELAQILEAERQALGAPGMSFAWFDGHDVPYAQGFGTKDSHADQPVLPTTLFRIASLTKMLTATGLMQQVDAGLVDLDAPISTYLPDLEFTLDPSWSDTITVRHVLDHTGAFYDYLEVNADASDEALSTFVTGWFAENMYLLAPPGRMWNYANPNFYVAGLVTERMSGRYYRPYLMDQVFEPLGMDRTLFLSDEVLADGDYANGWTPLFKLYGFEGPQVEPNTYDNGWARPAGYAWSSVTDLSRFGQFLMHGDPTVLSDGSLDALRGSQVNTLTAGDLAWYGFGLVVYHGFFVGDNFYNLPMYLHDGAIPGYSAIMYVVPDLEFGFVWLASTDGAYPSASVSSALELGGLPPPSAPPDLSPKPETFGDFVGHYTEPWQIVGPMDVALTDGNLTVRFPALDVLHVPYQPLLEPYTPDNFILTIQGSPLLLTFLRDQAGHTEYARTRLFVSTYDPTGASGSPVTERQLSPESLRQRLLRSLPEASSADQVRVELGPPAGRAAWARAAGRD